MKLKYWMAAKAIVEIVFGIGFVVLPMQMGSLFGMNLTPGGAYVGQLFGTAFIFGAIVLWLARGLTLADAGGRAIVIGVVASNTIGFVVGLMGVLSGAVNALGWLPVALYLVFGLGFAYFLFIKRSA